MADSDRKVSNKEHQGQDIAKVTVVLKFTDNTYHCKLCQNKTQSRNAFEEHVAAHCCSHPYVCIECSLKFRLKVEMDRHVQLVHKNERVRCCLHGLENVGKCMDGLLKNGIQKFKGFPRKKLDESSIDSAGVHVSFKRKSSVNDDNKVGNKTKTTEKSTQGSGSSSIPANSSEILYERDNDKSKTDNERLIGKSVDCSKGDVTQDGTMQDTRVCVSNIESQSEKHVSLNTDCVDVNSVCVSTSADDVNKNATHQSKVQVNISSCNLGDGSSTTSKPGNTSNITPGENHSTQSRQLKPGSRLTEVSELKCDIEDKSLDNDDHSRLSSRVTDRTTVTDSSTVIDSSTVPDSSTVTDSTAVTDSSTVTHSPKVTDSPTFSDSSTVPDSVLGLEECNPNSNSKSFNVSANRKEQKPNKLEMDSKKHLPVNPSQDKKECDSSTEMKKSSLWRCSSPDILSLNGLESSNVGSAQLKPGSSTNKIQGNSDVDSSSVSSTINKSSETSTVREKSAPTLKTQDLEVSEEQQVVDESLPKEPTVESHLHQQMVTPPESYMEANFSTESETLTHLLPQLTDLSKFLTPVPSETVMNSDPNSNSNITSAETIVVVQQSRNKNKKNESVDSCNKNLSLMDSLPKLSDNEIPVLPKESASSTVEIGCVRPTSPQVQEEIPKTSVLKKDNNRVCEDTSKEKDVSSIESKEHSANFLQDLNETTSGTKSDEHETSPVTDLLQDKGQQLSTAIDADAADTYRRQDEAEQCLPQGKEGQFTAAIDKSLPQFQVNTSEGGQDQSPTATTDRGPTREEPLHLVTPVVLVTRQQQQDQSAAASLQPLNTAADKDLQYDQGRLLTSTADDETQGMERRHNMSSDENTVQDQGLEVLASIDKDPEQEKVASIDSITDKDASINQAGQFIDSMDKDSSDKQQEQQHTPASSRDSEQDQSVSTGEKDSTRDQMILHHDTADKNPVHDEERSISYKSDKDQLQMEGSKLCSTTDEGSLEHQGRSLTTSTCLTQDQGQELLNVTDKDHPHDQKNSLTTEIDKNTLLTEERPLNLAASDGSSVDKGRSSTTTLESSNCPENGGKNEQPFGDTIHAGVVNLAPSENRNEIKESDVSTGKHSDQQEQKGKDSLEEQEQKGKDSLEEQEQKGKDSLEEQEQKGKDSLEEQEQKGKDSLEEQEQKGKDSLEEQEQKGKDSLEEQEQKGKDSLEEDLHLNFSQESYSDMLQLSDENERIVKSNLSTLNYSGTRSSDSKLSSSEHKSSPVRRFSVGKRILESPDRSSTTAMPPTSKEKGDASPKFKTMLDRNVYRQPASNVKDSGVGQGTSNNQQPVPEKQNTQGKNTILKKMFAQHVKEVLDHNQIQVEGLSALAQQNAQTLNWSQAKARTPSPVPQQQRQAQVGNQTQGRNPSPVSRSQTHVRTPSPVPQQQSFIQDGNATMVRSPSPVMMQQQMKTAGGNQTVVRDPSPVQQLLRQVQDGNQTQVRTLSPVLQQQRQAQPGNQIQCRVPSPVQLLQRQIQDGNQTQVRTPSPVPQQQRLVQGGNQTQVRTPSPVPQQQRLVQGGNQTQVRTPSPVPQQQRLEQDRPQIRGPPPPYRQPNAVSDTQPQAVSDTQPQAVSDTQPQTVSDYVLQEHEKIMAARMSIFNLTHPGQQKGKTSTAPNSSSVSNSTMSQTNYSASQLMSCQVVGTPMASNQMNQQSRASLPPQQQPVGPFMSIVPSTGVAAGMRAGPLNTMQQVRFQGNRDGQQTSVLPGQLSSYPQILSVSPARFPNSNPGIQPNILQMQHPALLQQIQGVRQGSTALVPQQVPGFIGRMPSGMLITPQGPRFNPTYILSKDGTLRSAQYVNSTSVQNQVQVRGPSPAMVQQQAQAWDGNQTQVRGSSPVTVQQQAHLQARGGNQSQDRGPSPVTAQQQAQAQGGNQAQVRGPAPVAKQQQAQAQGENQAQVRGPSPVAVQQQAQAQGGNQAQVEEPPVSVPLKKSAKLVGKISKQTSLKATTKIAELFRKSRGDKPSQKTDSPQVVESEIKDTSSVQPDRETAAAQPDTEGTGQPVSVVKKKGSRRGDFRKVGPDYLCNVCKIEMSSEIDFRRHIWTHLHIFKNLCPGCCSSAETASKCQLVMSVIDGLKYGCSVGVPDAEPVHIKTEHGDDDDVVIVEHVPPPKKVQHPALAIKQETTQTASSKTVAEVSVAQEGEITVQEMVRSSSTTECSRQEMLDVFPADAEQRNLNAPKDCQKESGETRSSVDYGPVEMNSDAEAEQMEDNSSTVTTYSQNTPRTLGKEKDRVNISRLIVSDSGRKLIYQYIAKKKQSQSNTAESENISSEQPKVVAIASGGKTIFLQTGKKQTAKSKTTESENIHTVQPVSTVEPAGESGEKSVNESVPVEPQGGETESTESEITNTISFVAESAELELNSLPTARTTGNFYVCGGFESCCFSCLTIADFYKHMSTAHNKAVSFLCFHCGYPCPSPQHLMRHLHSHLKNTSIFFPCFISGCRFQTNILHDLSSHIVTVHSQCNTYRCPFCEARFTSVDLLIQHIKDNTLKFARCPHCKVADTDVKRIKQHLASTHQNKSRQISVTCEIVCKERLKNNFQVTTSDGKVMELAQQADSTGPIFEEEIRATEHHQAAIQQATEIHQATVHHQATAQASEHRQATVQATVHHQATAQATVHHQATVQATEHHQATFQATVHHQATVQQPTEHHQATVQATVHHQATVQQPTEHHQATVQATVHHQATVQQPTVHHQATVQQPTEHHQATDALENAVSTRPSLSLKMNKRVESEITACDSTVSPTPSLSHLDGSATEEDPLSSDVDSTVSTKLQKCYRCSFTSKGKMAMNRHEKLHAMKSRDEKNFSCPLCPDSMAPIHMFREHMKSHIGNHTVTMYYCDLCHIYSNKLKTILTHGKQFHPSFNEDTDVSTRNMKFSFQGFVCDKCGYCTTSERVYNEHVETHVEEDTATPTIPLDRKCPYCIYHTQDEVMFNLHITNMHQKQLNKEKRNRKSSMEGDHSKHLKSVPKESESIPLIQSSEILQEKASSSSTAIEQLHDQNDISEKSTSAFSRENASPSQPEPNDSYQSQVAKRYHCCECTKGFSSTQQLKTHMEFHVKNTKKSYEIKLLRCSHCDYSTTERLWLERHNREQHKNSSKLTKQRREVIHVGQGAVETSNTARNVVQPSVDKKAFLIPEHSTFPQPVRCSECNFSTRDRASLVIHVTNHATLYPSFEDPSDSAEEEDRKDSSVNVEGERVDNTNNKNSKKESQDAPYSSQSQDFSTEDSEQDVIDLLTDESTDEYETDDNPSENYQEQQSAKYGSSTSKKIATASDKVATQSAQESLGISDKVGDDSSPALRPQRQSQDCDSLFRLGGDVLHNKLKPCFSQGLDNTFVCELCSKGSFSDKYDFHKHLLRHMKLWFYMCGYCDFHCFEQSAMTGHMTKAHHNRPNQILKMKPEDFRNGINEIIHCRKAGVSMSSLIKISPPKTSKGRAEENREDIKGHTSNSNAKQQCTSSGEKSKEIGKHSPEKDSVLGSEKSLNSQKTSGVGKVTTVGAFHKCSKCGFKSKDKNAVVRHLRVHSQANKHHCQHCPFQSSVAGDLHLHMAKRHPEMCKEKPHKTPCSRELKELLDDQKSRLKHKDLSQNQDGNDSSSSSDSSIVSMTSAEVGLKGLAAPKTPKDSKTLTVVQQKAGKKGSDNFRMKNGLYKCTYCPYCSKWGSNMSRHMKRMHKVKVICKGKAETNHNQKRDNAESSDAENDDSDSSDAENDDSGSSDAENDDSVSSNAENDDMESSDAENGESESSDSERNKAGSDIEDTDSDDEENGNNGKKSRRRLVLYTCDVKVNTEGHYWCPLCKAVLQHKFNLYRHAVKVHKAEIKEGYTCLTCKKDYKLRTHFLKHLKGAKCDEPWFLCPQRLCTVVFFDQQKAIKHIQKEHLVTKNPIVAKIRKSKLDKCVVKGNLMRQENPKEKEQKKKEEKLPSKKGEKITSKTEKKTPSKSKEKSPIKKKENSPMKKDKKAPANLCYTRSPEMEDVLCGGCGQQRNKCFAFQLHCNSKHFEQSLCCYYCQKFTTTLVCHMIFHTIDVHKKDVLKCFHVPKKPEHIEIARKFKRTFKAKTAQSNKNIVRTKRIFGCTRKVKSSKKSKTVTLAEKQKKTSALGKQKKVVAKQNSPVLSKSSGSKGNFRCLAIKECGYVCTSHDFMKVHIQRHLNYKPIKCGTCGLQFYMENYARMHHTKVHGPEVKFSFTMKSEAATEEKITRLLKRGDPCHSRNIEFSPEDVKKLRNGPKRLYKEVKGKTASWKCVECDLHSTSRQRMNNHVYKHLPKIYKCPFCKHTAYPRYKVLYHMEADHPTEDQTKPVINLLKTDGKQAESDGSSESSPASISSSESSDTDVYSGGGDENRSRARRSTTKSSGIPDNILESSDSDFAPPKTRKVTKRKKARISSDSDDENEAMERNRKRQKQSRQSLKSAKKRCLSTSSDTEEESEEETEENEEEEETTSSVHDSDESSSTNDDDEEETTAPRRRKRHRPLSDSSSEEKDHRPIQYFCHHCCFHSEDLKVYCRHLVTHGGYNQLCPRRLPENLQRPVEDELGRLTEGSSPKEGTTFCCAHCNFVAVTSFRVKQHITTQHPDNYTDYMEIHTKHQRSEVMSVAMQPSIIMTDICKMDLIDLCLMMKHEGVKMNSSEKQEHPDKGSETGDAVAGSSGEKKRKKFSIMSPSKYYKKSSTHTDVHQNNVLTDDKKNENLSDSKKSQTAERSMDVEEGPSCSHYGLSSSEPEQPRNIFNALVKLTQEDRNVHQGFENVFEEFMSAEEKMDANSSRIVNEDDSAVVPKPSETDKNFIGAEYLSAEGKKVTESARIVNENDPNKVDVISKQSESDKYYSVGARQSSSGIKVESAKSLPLSSTVTESVPEGENKVLEIDNSSINSERNSFESPVNSFVTQKSEMYENMSACSEESEHKSDCRDVRDKGQSVTDAGLTPVCSTTDNVDMADTYSDISDCNDSILSMDNILCEELPEVSEVPNTTQDNSSCDVASSYPSSTLELNCRKSSDMDLPPHLSNTSNPGPAQDLLAIDQGQEISLATENESSDQIPISDDEGGDQKFPSECVSMETDVDSGLQGDTQGKIIVDTAKTLENNLITARGDSSEQHVAFSESSQSPKGDNPLSSEIRDTLEKNSVTAKGDNSEQHVVLSESSQSPKGDNSLSSEITGDNVMSSIDSMLDSLSEIRQTHDAESNVKHSSDQESFNKHSSDQVKSLKHLTDQDKHLTDQDKQDKHLTDQDKHLTDQDKHLTDQDKHLTDQDKHLTDHEKPSNSSAMPSTGSQDSDNESCHSIGFEVNTDSQNL